MKQKHLVPVQHCVLPGVVEHVNIGWMQQVLVPPQVMVGSTGQSLVVPQPQKLPLSQTWPFGLVAQSTQAPLPAPQVVLAVPALQVPAAQQPVLHAVRLAMPQDLPQRCMVVLQAVFSGQSMGTLQPQLALFALRKQALPLLLFKQLMQAPPGRPQAAPSLPAAQVLLTGLQQPPLQVRPPAHELEHRPVLVLHASSELQSLLDAQPHT